MRLEVRPIDLLLAELLLRLEGTFCQVPLAAPLSPVAGEDWLPLSATATALSPNVKFVSALLL